MANRFRLKENRATEDIKTEEIESPKRNEQKKSQTPSSEKGSTNVSVKKIRKILDNVFGLGILKKINLKKNLSYFVMVVLMIIWLINNSLKIQSKRAEIENLKDDITKVNDRLMDIIEEEYNIDDMLEKELLQKAKDDGFQSSGYIPYTIKINKKQ